MDRRLLLSDLVDRIKHFIALSRDPMLSDLARSVLAEHAKALCQCYRAPYEVRGIDAQGNPWVEYWAVLQ